MLTDKIKKLVPMKVKAAIKLGDKRSFYKDRIEALAAEKEPFDLLLGTPIHTNLGDHLIALAERERLEKKNGRKLIEIPTEAFRLYRKKLEHISLPDNVIVYITGGGWMGDLWIPEEKILEDMVYTFREHKVIILPQTVYYADDKSPLIERGNGIYRQCRDLTLYVRDPASYSFAKEHLAIDRVYLVPDIGLLYEYESGKMPYIDSAIAGICLRDDRETTRDEEKTATVRAILSHEGYKLKSISTMADHMVGEAERKEAVDKALGEFSSCSIILTDRLHGMIFAYLTGVPCIVLDNKTGKVSGVYRKWLSACPYLMLADGEDVGDDVRWFISRHKGKKYIPASFEMVFSETSDGLI